MANALESLKKVTLVVADSGDFGLIEAYKPQDSTTNPSLIYAASKLPQYSKLVDNALEHAKAHSQGKDRQAIIESAIDKLAVNFGAEILKIVPGRVSTEIDARLSFNTDETVARAHGIIALYKEVGIDKERILIKIASTWEGIQAAKKLEAEGIHCNLTLLFSLAQAAAAAEAKATLISPFVGRITDFYKAKQGVQGFEAEQDPGVLSVRAIYNYYKFHGYPTIVMGASFRNTGQIIALAGCDALTISPALLGELAKHEGSIERKLNPSSPHEVPKLEPSEGAFRWALNEDEMATNKLSEGIRLFTADLVKLEADISKKLDQK